MDNNELRPVRRYTRIEAAEALNISQYWLRDWVAEGRVPHRRKGKQRGVWFTWEDIIAIGEMLPALMTSRQGTGRAEAATGDAGADAGPSAGGTTAGLPPDVLASFAGLRSLRSE